MFIERLQKERSSTETRSRYSEFRTKRKKKTENTCYRRLIIKRETLAMRTVQYITIHYVRILL